MLQDIPPDLKDIKSLKAIPDPAEYTKMLGVEWNAALDYFQLTVAEQPPLENVTKRLLVSDVAKTFDVLGWFSPTTKILLQQLWEAKLGWDDTVPPPLCDTWLQWRSKLKLLTFLDAIFPRAFMLPPYNYMDSVSVGAGVCRSGISSNGRR